VYFQCKWQAVKLYRLLLYKKNDHIKQWFDGKRFSEFKQWAHCIDAYLARTLSPACVGGAMLLMLLLWIWLTRTCRCDGGAPGCSRWCSRRGIHAVKSDVIVKKDHQSFSFIINDKDVSICVAFNQRAMDLADATEARIWFLFFPSFLQCMCIMVESSWSIKHKLCNPDDNTVRISGYQQWNRLTRRV